MEYLVIADGGLQVSFKKKDLKHDKTWSVLYQDNQPEY